MTPERLGYTPAGVGECDGCHVSPSLLYAISTDAEGAWWYCDACILRGAA